MGKHPISSKIISTLLEKLRLKFAQFHNFSKNNKFYHFNKFFHFFRSPIEANRPLDKPKPPKPRTHDQLKQMRFIKLCNDPILSEGSNLR